jgi:hypothetical protein
MMNMKEFIKYCKDNNDTCGSLSCNKCPYHRANAKQSMCKLEEDVERSLRTNNRIEKLKKIGRYRNYSYIYCPLW